MQLATQLGDHATVRHILHKQCEVEWVWGPVTQFSLDLVGVDSAGKGGGDIMELIVRDRGSPHAQLTVPALVPTAHLCTLLTAVACMHAPSSLCMCP